MAIHMFYIGKWQSHIYLIAGPSEMIKCYVQLWNKLASLLVLYYIFDIV